MAVIFNAKGTSVDNFTIGKAGPTITRSGSNLTVGSATLTAAQFIGPATQLTVADTADTTTNVVLVGNATGDENALTDAGLTYNAATAALTATTFVGSLSGNATTATGATNIDINATTSTDTTTFPVLVGAAATGNQLPFVDNVDLSYNASTAALSTTTFIGALTGNADTATTATTATNATNINVTDESADTATNVVFVNAATGNQLPHTGTNLTFNSSTGNISATQFGGIIEANLLDKAAAEVITGAWAIPSLINTQNGAYTLVLLDAGKTIRKATSTASITHTIPANASVAFPIGTLIGWQNDGTVDMTIAITTDTLTGTDAVSGSKTLGPSDTAVIQKVEATIWKYAASDA